MDFIQFIEHAETVQEFGAIIDSVPDTFSIGIDFTCSSLTGSAAWSVTQSFRTSLTTDKRRRGENTFTAVLASEDGHFDEIFKEEQES